MTDVLEAIAHPGRRAMLVAVLEGERPAGELAEFAGLKQPAASQHLRVLREAGLVAVRVDGPRRLYRVDPDGLARLREELDAFWAPSLQALRRVAEGERRP
ncbi:MAG TPA: metalloregulator ArsR/SmtB family transcription factor [Actinomycetota bacterium]